MFVNCKQDLNCKMFTILVNIEPHLLPDTKLGTMRISLKKIIWQRQNINAKTIKQNAILEYNEIGTVSSLPSNIVHYPSKYQSSTNSWKCTKTRINQTNLLCDCLLNSYRICVVHVVCTGYLCSSVKMATCYFEKQNYGNRTQSHVEKSYYVKL